MTRCSNIKQYWLHRIVGDRGIRVIWDLAKFRQEFTGSDTFAKGAVGEWTVI